MEIESALVAHPHVAEAAVVSKAHDIKGESVFAYVVLNIARPEGGQANSLIEELRIWVGEQLSPIAKPDEIRFTDNLPKTRSGKIMRRLLRSIARGEEITQDMSTLENPGILEQLRGGAALAPDVKKAAIRKQAGPSKRAAPSKRAGPAKRSGTVKRAAALPEAKKPKAAVKGGKRVAGVKHAKRKVVDAKSRRAPAKAVRGKPRRKK